MRKNNEIKEIIEKLGKPDFSIKAKSEKNGVTVDCEGSKTDLLFGLSMIIESFKDKEVANEGEIRKVVDLVFKDKEEIAEDLLDKLKEINKHLDKIMKNL